MERAKGVEPSSSAWEAEVMPLYDARVGAILTLHQNDVELLLGVAAFGVERDGKADEFR